MSEVFSSQDHSLKSWAAKGIIAKRHLQSQLVTTRDPDRGEFSLVEHDLPRLTLERVDESPSDGFRKLLFRTHDGLGVETVIIPLHKPGMHSICLSSQIGCVMGCRFCATAKMPVRRNLETWEIVDQFLQAKQIVQQRNHRVTGAVFMGMGEPFLNYDRVIASAQLLSFPTAQAISSKAITISTVGHVAEINRFTEEGHKFRLSISLGAATDEKRALIVPVAARIPVQEVMAAARRHAEKRRDRINLSYVCIQGINVSDEDARALAELIGKTPVRLDLIEVRDRGGEFFPPTEEELGRFRDALNRYLGQPVVRRYSGGGDINAACGTLAGDMFPPENSQSTPERDYQPSSRKTLHEIPIT